MLDPKDTSPEFTSVVTPPPVAATGMPQFATAEYAHIPGSERCRICGNLIPGEYYRIHDQMVCSTCGRQALSGQPTDSHAAFVRGLLLGSGAALLGLAAYATIFVVTGWYIGYVALGVGWFIAKAITWGSNGLGGRRYQVAAVLLTYLAISMAAIPIAIAEYIKEGKDGSAASTATPAGNGKQSGNDTSQSPQAKPNSDIHWVPLLGELLLMGLISPFMALQDPIHGLLGLFILFIGIRIAWQLTRARVLPVDGPYSLGSP